MKMRFNLLVFILINYSNGGPIETSDEGDWSKDTELLNNLILNRDELDCENNGSTFCEKVNSHQYKIIESLLGRTDIKQFEGLFGEDEITNKIGPRNNLAANEIELCESIEKLIYPLRAKSISNEWHFIANNDRYKQGIRVEMCINSTLESTDKRSTSGLPKCKMTENFPNGYSSECTQKYVNRHLVALDANNEKIIKETFTLPSCCQCILKN